VRCKWRIQKSDTVLFLISSPLTLFFPPLLETLHYIQWRAQIPPFLGVLGFVRHP
jgi:hypothetical protein